MRLTLRPYQEDALARVATREANGVRRQLGVAATGLGKTVVFCALAERMGSRTLILAHRDELIAQAAAKVREVWPEVPSLGIVQGQSNEAAAHVVVASVQTVSRPNRLARLCPPHSGPQSLSDGPSPGMLAGGWADPFGLVVVDEAHHTAAATYRRILDHLGAGLENGPLLLGVTATPDRGDGKGLDDLFDEIAFSYDILWGIRSGYLCDLRGVAIKLADLDVAGIAVSRGDYQTGAAGDALLDAGAPDAIAEAWLAHAAGRRTLVFTPTVETAQLTAAAFTHRGVAAESVSGDMSLEDRRLILKRFDRGEVDVVVNCMVLTEGYDAPRVDCIVVARPTKSRALYCFDATTEVLTPTGWVPGRSVTEGDIIAAFDLSDSAVRWEPVLAHIERPLLPEEGMVALRSSSTDLRVTDTHRMVWRRREGRARQRGPWAVSLAGDLLQRTDSWDLPVAGHEKAPGVPLSDAELAFIGWVQTDGCVNKRNGVVQISQQYPEQRSHIEATLNACGLKWRVSEHSEPTAYGERRYPLAVYRVSRGAPRGTAEHLTGWGHLSPWLPKADPDAWGRLEAMDAYQWAVLLDAWHRGDGAKQVGQTWTRRSYHLSIADEWTAGWVQGMCMRRGWRANVAYQGSVWIVHCRPGEARYIGGTAATDRPHMERSPEMPGERVWCVSVPSGAILTRRNGKGAIIGQTQMIGRGTRRHPDKTDCLVLDVVGASDEHSLVTVPSLFGVERRLRERLEGEDRPVSEVVAEYEAQEVEAGRLRAQDVELFTQVRATLAWVEARRSGDPRRRYALSISRDEALVMLQTDPDDDASWGVQAQQRLGIDRQLRVRTLMRDVSLEFAEGVAEDYARRFGQRHLVNPNAAWRSNPPSAKAKAAARKWGLDPGRYRTAGELSDAMSARIHRVKAPR